MTAEELKEKQEVREAMDIMTEFIKKNMFRLDSTVPKYWVDLTRSIERYWNLRERNG